jgi:hypothetical protein
MKIKKSKTIRSYRSLSLPKPLLEIVKKHIQSNPEYNTISEFIREAIREKIRNEIIYTPDDNIDDLDEEEYVECNFNNNIQESAKGEISMFG